MRIPVFAGCRIIAFVAPAQAMRYASAKNAEVVKQRKTKKIVRINLRSMGDDTAERSLGIVGPVYEEPLESGHVNVASIIGAGGSFRRWGKDDRFSPRRFNSDRLIPTTTVERMAYSR